MDLGKVIGTVVATRKDPSLEGTRLLLVQPLDEKYKPIAEPLVAVDTLHDAGVDEIVYIVTAVMPWALYRENGCRLMSPSSELSIRFRCLMKQTQAQKWKIEKCTLPK